MKASLNKQEQPNGSSLVQHSCSESFIWRAEVVVRGSEGSVLLSRTLWAWTGMGTG